MLPDPEPLAALLVELVNTERLGTGAFDLLAELRGANAWLRRARLPTVDADELQRLRLLREALREAFVAHADGRSSTAAQARLAVATKEAGLLPAFLERGGVRLVAKHDNAEARLAAAAFWLQASGRWSRIKACASDTCHWAFWDESKNGSRTWCAMMPCGNRMKARAFRARQAR